MQLTACYGLRILLLTVALHAAAAAQTPQPSPALPDVLRVNTELVQSDVMVFDKQGRVVNGLQRAQFELTVDGKPQPISLIEEVRAGTAKERIQLALEAAKSQVAVQARLLHRGQIVKTISLSRLGVNPSDPKRIPFAGELSLTSVRQGSYLLEVTATGGTGKVNAIQVTRITVE
jgi:hypothetical protein